VPEAAEEILAQDNRQRENHWMEPGQTAAGCLYGEPMAPPPWNRGAPWSERRNAGPSEAGCCGLPGKQDFAMSSPNKLFDRA